VLPSVVAAGADIARCQPLLFTALLRAACLSLLLLLLLVMLRLLWRWVSAAAAQQATCAPELHRHLAQQRAVVRIVCAKHIRTSAWRLEVDLQQQRHEPAQQTTLVSAASFLAPQPASSSKQHSAKPVA
jgi:uncharacterized membrane protein affecting hemolysin expression